MKPHRFAQAFLPLVAVLAGGCGIVATGSDSAVTLTVDNEMSECSWNFEVNGSEESVAAGSTGSISGIESGSAVTFTATATAGSCSIGTSDSGSNSTVSSNGVCQLNTGSSSTLTVTLEPSSGYGSTSSTPNNTTLICP